MRLRRRIGLLFGALAALLVFGVAVTAYVEDRRDDLEHSTQELLQPSRRDLSEVLVDLVDQEAAQRGYLLTGDETFLAPYRQALEKTEETLDRARARAEGYGEIQAGVDRVRSRVQAWLQLGADFEIRERQSGRAEVAAELVGSGTSRRLFELARDEILATRAMVDDAVTDEERSIDDFSTLLRITLVVNLLATLGLLIAARSLVGQWVTEPIAGLAGAVRRAASGALRDPVEATGPPDIVELAADVDAMRQRLLAEVDDATRARAALADRGMIVVTLRDDLAPSEVQLPPGLSFAGRFRPARGLVAGDWYDLRENGNDLSLALVDVAGHGAEVATFALRTKALATAVLGERSPGEVLDWVAGRLGETAELFLTGAVLDVNADTGSVRYASAGHPSLLLGNLTGVRELLPTGPMLGPLPGTWSTAEVELERGGVLVVYSDGLIEARDEDGESFGVRRLVEIVTENQLSGADAVADACLEAVERFSRGAPRDDITVCALSR